MRNENIAKVAAEVESVMLEKTGEYILQVCLNEIKWRADCKNKTVDDYKRILVYLKMAVESVEGILEEREKDKEDILKLFK